jgi:hypothetical protein
MKQGAVQRWPVLVVIGSLLCLWLGLVAFGWARWGSVTIDSGREIYVAAALAEGQMLYRDVWYPYLPGAPYLNSLLFRTFGIHIYVLYVAGSLAGLALGLTLFRCALYFTSLSVAATIAYVVLIQSFVPGIFTYPLPYSYASVYGSVAAAIFLLYAIRVASDPMRSNVFLAGLWSAIALLMKTEFGLACFVTLSVLLIGLSIQQRSIRAALVNLAAVTPALLICAVVIAWMVSIDGVAFITEENFMSWPTSYFMQTYGQSWLRATGFDLSFGSFRSGLARTLRFVIFWLGFRLLLWLPRKSSRLSLGIPVLLAMVVAALWKFQPEQVGSYLAKMIFPEPMVFIVGLAVPVAVFRFWRSGWRAENLTILALMSFAPLLAFRILFAMSPEVYGIYYNGPVLIAFFLVLTEIAIPGDKFRNSIGARAATLLLCAAVGSWVTVQLYPRYAVMRDGRIRFQNERGRVDLPDTMFPAWAETVDFIQEAKRRGQIVMSIPEDVALYFFAGVFCPTRVSTFTPGTLAPGRMFNKTIEEMKRAPVHYVIWSNREFSEYGVREFGKDFDVELADYVRKNYQPVRSFGSPNLPNAWQATVWEAKPGT